MRTAFRALLRKETRQMWPFALGAAVGLGLSYFNTLFDAVSNGPGSGFGWNHSLTAVAAVLFGFYQAYREAGGDMRSFAIHRPATGAQIMGAKLVAGIGLLLVGLFVPYALAISWISVPGHPAIPFDPSYWVAGIAGFFAALTYYAGGLYGGARQGRIVSRGIGIGAALLASTIVAIADSFTVAIISTAVLATLVMAAAWSEFMHGSEFDAQPWWGRTANALSGVAAMVVVVVLVGGATAMLASANPMSLIKAPGEAKSILAGLAVVWLAAATVAFWLCRRYAFSVQRTVSWTALAALTGPIALVLMWLFLEWPAREMCSDCDEARVVNRKRCEHCGAIRAGLDTDGTEVFAMG